MVPFHDGDYTSFTAKKQPSNGCSYALIPEEKWIPALSRVMPGTLIAKALRKSAQAASPKWCSLCAFPSPSRKLSLRFSSIKPRADPGTLLLILEPVRIQHLDNSGGVSHRDGIIRYIFGYDRRSSYHRVFPDIVRYRFCSAAAFHPSLRRADIPIRDPIMISGWQEGSKNVPGKSFACHKNSLLRIHPAVFTGVSGHGRTAKRAKPLCALRHRGIRLPHWMIS